MQQVKARQIKGVDYPDHEAMPSSEDWGTYGWTCCDLESARKRLEIARRQFERNQTHLAASDALAAKG